MKSFKNPTKLATLYSVASIFLGPLIFILGYGFTRGGGDYCDSVYYLPNGLIDPSRITEFRNAQIFQVTGSSLMLVLGLFIVIHLFTSSHKKQTKLNAWAVLAVVLVMLGYILVILMSGKGGQNC